MQGVEVVDSVEVAGVRVSVLSLADFFAAFERQVRASTWFCSAVESVGERAGEGEPAFPSGTPLGGEEMLRAACRSPRILRGTLEAVRTPGAAPWLRVTATAAAPLRVESTDDEVIRWVREHFRVVRSLHESSPREAALRAVREIEKASPGSEKVPPSRRSLEDVAVNFLYSLASDQAGRDRLGGSFSRGAQIVLGILSLLTAIGFLALIFIPTEVAVLELRFRVGMAVLGAFCLTIALACLVPQTRRWALPLIVAVIVLAFVLIQFV